MIALALALIQESVEPIGPAGWTLRNWLGLGCQVVVFILLVAFIFWLADLGDRDDATGPGEPGPPPVAPSPPAGPDAGDAPAGTPGGLPPAADRPV